MRKIPVTIIASFMMMSPASFAVSLEASFSSALATNVTEKVNDSRIQQRLEQKRQEQSAYFPSIGLKGTYNKQDKIDSTRTVGLNLSQSLYNGGRDSLAIESANTNIEIARNQRQIDRKALLLDVIEAYYTYYLNLNDMSNLELLKKQSKERSDEIRKRVQIGRSRRGEQLQAEAQLASVEAQAFNGSGLLHESESLFYLITGLPKEEKPEVQTEAGMNIQSKSLDEYLTVALNQEDVKNRRLALEQIEREIKVSKSHYLPSLDLTSNYYFDRDGGSAAQRNSDWDIGLQLVFPLYEGGFSQATYRENVERKTTATYELTDYEKAIKIEVTKRYETFRRYNDQIKAFDLALDKGKRSYDEAVKDYRLGLVSNLDVLSALNVYLDNKRNAEKTRIQALMNKHMLEAVVGEMK